MSRAHLTESDSGKILPVRVGDELMIELNENAATGFVWEIESLGERVERLDPVESESAGRRLPGSVGKFRLHLVAHKPGENAIRLKYWRDWEGETSVNSRYQLTLRISS